MSAIAPIIDEKFYNESSYFERKSKIFEDLENKFQKYRIRKVLEIYKPQKNETVLDLGCAWGTFCFVLAPTVKKVTGLDFSKKSIEICKKLLKKTKFKNINFICANAEKTKFPPKSFDVIVAADLFEHLYPDSSDKVIQEAFRLLKKNGKFVIWTPHRGHILEILKNNDILLKRDISHVDYKKMSTLINSLKNAGFRIKKHYYAESHNPGLSVIERKLLKYIPIFRRRIAILAERAS